MESGKESVERERKWETGKNVESVKQICEERRNEKVKRI